MAKDNGTESTQKLSPRGWPVPMKFLDASHPIYSNPTGIMFVPRKRSSSDSEIREPRRPSSDSTRSQRS